MTKRWIAGVVAATWLVAGCSGSGGDDADSTTTTKAEAAETTTTVDPTAEVGEDFQALAETADEAIDEEATTRDEFAAENDLEGAIDSTRDLRNDLFDFDAAVRELDVPEEYASEVNDVLTETARYIEVLDGFVEVTDIPAYNDQLDEESEVRDSWTESVNVLAESLGTDGLGTDDGGDDDDPPSEEAEIVDAGGTVTDGTLSMEVPEGFTGTDGATIQMEHESGALLGIYSVYPESATTLEDVAKESIEGAAEKNGFEITAGPEELEVGDFQAIGYSSTATDGTMMVDVYFDTEVDADNRFRVISVEVSEDDIDEVMSAVEAAAPTVTLD
ncbi:hypothetical protein ACE2AJ_11500 [Aquihabitans daechungensis]|uniref:hypothetical protein n=1 Tax=Aquihabitans daechungensis TaxID=1052257 RepID=UPI003BA1C39F